VVVIDKPIGPTSHDVVARVRRLLGTRAVGHAGTLDPLASGVLVVAIEEGTKLVPWLTAHDKAYRATVRLGEGTRSFDAEGEIEERRPIEPAVREALAAAARGEFAEVLEAALAIERARVEQVPPAVSAIKVDGVAAHARVRRGDEVTLPPRPIAVRALRVLGARTEPAEIDVELEVAKGYYVRAFARDLAASLGTVAHLTALRRLRSGPFTLDEAVPLERDALLAGLLPLATAAQRTLPAAVLTPEGVLRARQGKRLSTEHFQAAPSALSVWLDPEGIAVAVGEPEEALFRVVRGFVPPPPVVRSEAP
jgi:tRNA pseudouridine55 synthase